MSQYARNTTVTLRGNHAALGADGGRRPRRKTSKYAKSALVFWSLYARNTTVTLRGNHAPLGADGGRRSAGGGRDERRQSTRKARWVFGACTRGTQRFYYKQDCAQRSELGTQTASSVRKSELRTKKTSSARKRQAQYDKANSVRKRRAQYAKDELGTNDANLSTKAARSFREPVRAEHNGSTICAHELGNL